MPRLKSLSVQGHMSMDWRLEFGNLNLIIGPTGRNKTAIVTALEILLYGTYTGGERQYNRADLVLAAAGRRGSNGARYEGAFINPEINISRDLFWADNGKLDHSVRSSLAHGTTSVVQKAINTMFGDRPMHFDAGAFARLPDEKLRSLIFDSLKSSSYVGDLISNDELQQLSEKAGQWNKQNKLKNSFDWLNGIRNSIIDHRKHKKNRKNEISSALRELSAGTISSNAALIEMKRSELNRLQNERDEHAKLIGEINSLCEQRANYRSEINRLQNELKKCENAASKMADLEIDISEITKEQAAAVKRVNDALDEIDRCRKQEQETSAGVEELDSDIRTMKAEISQLESKLRHMKDMKCPECGLDISDQLVSEASFHIDNLRKEIAECEELRPKFLEAVSQANDDRIGAAEAYRLATEVNDALVEKLKKSNKELDETKYITSKKTEFEDTLDKIQKKISDFGSPAKKDTTEELMKATTSKINELLSELNQAERAMARQEQKAKLEEERIRIDEEIKEINDVLAIADEMRAKATNKLLEPLSEIIRPFIGGLGELGVQSEDEKGKSCFRIGLERDGIFRKLDMLSSGERCVVLPSLSLALDICRGNEHPIVIYDSIETLHNSLREAMLRNLTKMVENEKISQAFVTWNADTTDVPDWLMDWLTKHRNNLLIDLNQT